VIVPWGGRFESELDGVTRDVHYRCPRCGYVGALLLRLSRKRTTVLRVVPLRGWREDGGCLGCPICWHRAGIVTPATYRQIPRIDSGTELADALRRIEAAVRSSDSQFAGKFRDGVLTLLADYRRNRSCGP
jgi:hypothetical protein